MLEGLMKYNNNVYIYQIIKTSVTQNSDICIYLPFIGIVSDSWYVSDITETKIW